MTLVHIAESTSERIFPRRFDQFVLVTQVGEGGMGRVYVALTPKAELCVIKRFGNPRAEMPQSLLGEYNERFRREAAITMALSHPCIAQTFHSVHRGVDSYLVQEFIRGCTLDYLTDSVSRTGKSIPVALAAYVVGQIADALAYLHGFQGLGLVHRDLCAPNVMFSQDGQIKVIDFGIAKATSLDDQLTAPHLVVGKKLWTAPELVLGRKPDRRTDLYALGLLSWYLLSGRDPSEELNPPEKPAPGLPPPSTFNSEVVPDLDALVTKSTHPHPDRRFQTAEDFRQAISAFIPSGFQGQAELSKLVRQHQLTGESERFAALVERARPLLKSAPSGRRASNQSPLEYKSLVLMLAGALLVLGSAYFVSPRNKQERDPSRPLDPPATLAPVSLTTADLPTPPPQVPPAPPALESLKVASHPPEPRLRTRNRSHAVRSSSPSSPKITHSDPAELLGAAFEAAATGNSAEALRLARASKEVQPSAESDILIGRLLFTSDPAAAEAAFESALRLSPDNRQATRALDKLRNRRQ